MRNVQAGRFTDDGTLNSYLSGAVTAFPDRPAVSDRHVRLTYAQLDELSRRVAGVLAGREPVAGARIALWLNKSVETVAAIYAVLRSGAAYVPVDPTAPPRRAAHIVADCGATWLVTTAERAKALATSAPEALESLNLLLVDHDQPDLGSLPAVVDRPLRFWKDVDGIANVGPAGVPVEPDDVAYILYTSGSTGSPKGVAHTHRSARAFVDWAAEEFDLTSDDVLASHAPFHFDLSTFDLFAASRSGSRVALVPEMWQGMGRALVHFILENDVSVWYSVPTVLRRIAEASDGAPLAASKLRVIAFAGEEYPLRHVRELAAVVAPDTRLYNLYGPTETNVCTYHRLDQHDLADEVLHAPPIGRACPYATAALLDQDGRLSPPEAGTDVGELCIAGGSVMLSYWDDAVKTASAFLETGGTRYYRTGDMVRRDAEGRFTFLGRDDGMVKVSGYRIELGEIEAVLDSRPDVQEAVCLVVPGENGASRLVAFVTTVGDTAPPDARELRRHCRDRLPGYMIPELIETLPALHYTSTGKIDRRSLSELVVTR